ncbi:L-ribulose-5-phosphate 4-epimerase [Carnobacterium divergens]|uniref:L-ribulose-5-phosphate 4-epimerase n=1 Tax=Carnobacterium divergens TaxID=2748 RepID=A0A7Z8G4S9_CARDV|nr:L-ribulose-5-phosphate 4-epimerase [Carnobacterium divergens]TFI71564.1 L-ribulose-5-phosphate 4-epimerase [Carnobacterium divergens]TFI76206.1 L-ribulose-5-phosphate 4-epimerase [Carnobacterium divergens]TFI82078.1 L-ribulose-5-phosphate 4-epimerase [Carnobacterium divergens]TFI94387.1 L-ribulose-5-phosphate 4-epimerase [Carnobacterium divergens]TFJ10667.1 L-ribulose-5-phosphate 4-epimerase [Carnobacterium divergens]
MTNDVIKKMKEDVYKANVALSKHGLVKLTWGNVSQINRKLGVVVIKPSGVAYNMMTAQDMVVTDLQGNKISGTLNPSSDLSTHIILYQAFKEIKSVVHTHSKWAVSWAQAGRSIPAYGTTHADAFYGSIPCTRELTKQEIESAYEIETGNVIIETFRENQLDPHAIPGVIVKGHGPFTWGEDSKKAVENSLILEEVAEMAMHTEAAYFTRQEAPNLSQYLLEKHYLRKHGENAYYGQSQ